LQRNPSLRRRAEALALDPSDTITRSNRGIVLYSLGRFEDALAAYDQALAVNPSGANTHNNRGEALQSLGQFEDALAAYEDALALKPGNATAHENKGIALTMIGDINSALAELDMADTLAPAGAGAGRTWAGVILWHRQDAAAARDRFVLVKGRVTGCTPFRTAAMEAIALCALGQPYDAEQHLLNAVPLRALGDRPEPRAIYDLLSDPPLPGIDRLRAIIDNDASV
jgi:tetratricopeptide (TPR) repeat protein